MVLRLFKFWVILSFSIFVQAEELKNVTPESFLVDNPSAERKAIIDFIIHQFDGRTVSQADLDKLWNYEKAKKTAIARFQIINQKLYVATTNKDSTFMRVFEYFNEFITHYQVRDVDFILYDVDIIKDPNIESDLHHIPAFMMSKNLDDLRESNKFLMPNHHMIIKPWKNMIKHIEEFNLKYLWDSKINKIFWRGADSDALDFVHSIDDINKSARLKLVLLSKLYPDLIDAKFSSLRSTHQIKKIFTLLFSDGEEFVAAGNHLQYKYLISLDGATCAWARVPWIMYSNSVLLKQETAKIEWFYTALKPYVHYVPVNKKLTDIFTQLEWIKNHDIELQQISNNAHNFVANNLMPEHIDSHMAIILNEYAKIQQDKEIHATLVAADDFFTLGGLLKSLVIMYKNRLAGKVTSWFY